MNEVFQQMGRMSQIGVHHDYRFALHVFKSCQNGRFFPEVAGKRYVFDAMVSGGQFFNLLKGVIRASVIDVENFIVIMNRLKLFLKIHG